MRLTNANNIPVQIVRAVENDGYTKGEAEMSVTGLLQPPQLSILRKHHEASITEDVADRIWMLLGQSIHSVLERANAGRDGALIEKRIYENVLGMQISGQPDELSLDRNECIDYKVTSVYKVKDALKGANKDWTEQLNTYAWLANRRLGLKIDKLKVIAISRDWSKFQYMRSSGDYPAAPVSTIPIQCWSEEKQRAFIEGRVALHQSAAKEFAETEELPECTAEEQWRKEDTFRVMKPGRKSALRILSSREEAEGWVEAHKDKEKLLIDFSPGKAVRCENYCAVAPFCQQHSKEKESV
jgi:hypothetical protein